MDWSNFVRDICAEDVRLNPRQLGGFNNNDLAIAVEIAESFLPSEVPQRATCERCKGLCCH